MEERDLTQEAIEKALSWAEATEDFIAREAPLLVQEIITWGIVSNGFRAVIFLAISATAAWLSRKSYRLVDGDATDEENSPYIGGAVAFGVLCVGSTALMLMNTYWAIYPIVAPRMYVIEELSKLVN